MDRPRERSGELSLMFPWLVVVLGAYGWSHAVGASACFVSGDRWESTVLPSMCSWSDGESDPSGVFSVWDSPVPVSMVY